MADSTPGGKSYFILCLIFIVTVGTVIYIVQYQTTRIITKLTLNYAQTTNHSLINYIAELKGRAVMRAEVISGYDGIISALKNGNYETLQKNMQAFSQGVDVATICDSDGAVIARSHNARTGDNISTYKAISTALRTGKTATSIERISISDNDLSVYASAPILDGGRVIGCVNCTYDLAKNEYVDEFKERTGCEATIFMGNERISTTITNEAGSRITGTIAYDFIAKTVIGKQTEYMGKLTLFGKEYGVCYSPLITDGQAIGMLFTGVDISFSREGQRTMNAWIILASCIGIAASIAFILYSRSIRRKYAMLAERQLNQQLLMANISRSFLSDGDTGLLITETLHKIGEFMGISQVLLFWLEDDGCTLTCRNEWLNQKHGLQSRIGDTLPLKEPMLSMIKALVPGIGKDSCMTSNDPVFKQAMAPYRVSYQNFIATPIFSKKEMIGVVDFSKANDVSLWSDSDISLATLAASTLSGVFEREAMGRRTSIVENSPHIIFYFDTSGNLAYANPAASIVSGYSLNELKEGGFGLLFDEKTVRRIKEEYIPNALHNGTDCRENILICKDGSRRILETTNFILKDGIVASIAVDVTDMRAMAAELINAKNTADKASRAKTDFLSRMSHEMRTPMNAIINMAAIAREAEDKDRTNYALSKVNIASTHLLGIINDILDMTSIEVDNLELANVEFNVRDLLKKAVSFLDFSLDEKRLRFSMHIDDNVPLYCAGDDQRLKQIIMKLFSNAAKFTPESGEIIFDVSMTGEENGMCELCFEVADSGIGISPEQMDKIFQMFEQAENGANRKYGGTGLGLTITKHMVELMGGAIAVKSELGKGARFIFTVKLRRVDKALPGAGQGDQDEGGGTEGEFEGKRLLIAEDIEINREILVSLLDGAGLVIDTAANGKEAFEKVAAAHGLYDMIFMDMQMPEVDGLEATRLIRAFEAETPGLDRLPIVAMTANVFKDDIDNCLSAGMNDHIGKPISIDTVYEKLRKFL